MTETSSRPSVGRRRSAVGSPQSSSIPLLFAFPLLLASAAQADIPWAPHIRRVSDHLVAQQTPHGCIPDAPDALRANTDGAMERALVGLAFGFRFSGSARHRIAVREGAKWLATCMEKKDPKWAGTWRYAYSAKPPYVALPTSPDGKALDARGLSSTCALFPYIVAVYTGVSGDTSLARSTRPHVRAALDFILDHNRSANGLFYRGWYQNKETQAWELCPEQRAIDQADVYLGLRAGQWLLGQDRFGVAADKLIRELPRLLFDKKERALATGLDGKGNPFPPIDDCESYFVQGYLAWVFGAMKETECGMKWLDERLAPDGSFRKKKTDTPYIMPACAYCMGAARLGIYPTQLRLAKTWALGIGVTKEGAVREIADLKSATHNRLACWAILAWVSLMPCPFGDDTP